MARRFSGGKPGVRAKIAAASGSCARRCDREAEHGRLDPRLVEGIAHIVLAGLIELGLMISRSECPTETEQLARAALDHLLARLLDA